jgi:hypothetical protein
LPTRTGPASSTCTSRICVPRSITPSAVPRRDRAGAGYRLRLDGGA